jgi:hypothetical protein
MIKLLIIILFLIFSFFTHSQIKIFVNDSAKTTQRTIYCKQIDTISFINKAFNFQDFYWCEIVSIQSNYDKTSKEQFLKPDSIQYKINILTNEQTYSILSPKLGTAYYACFHKSDKLLFSRTICETKPINNLTNMQIIQLVVRLNDSYIGYLTELFNTPFILPPVKITGYGHQTDLRIGSDCAELAIYGKRREGYNIPYCGPHGIVKYLDQLNEYEIFEGCIIHFGSQVSVLYQDKGIKNKLDKKDILIQSYLTKANFISYFNSGFYRKKYRVFKWKDNYEKQ